MKNENLYESPLMTLVTFDSESGFAASGSEGYGASTEKYDIQNPLQWN